MDVFRQSPFLPLRALLIYFVDYDLDLFVLFWDKLYLGIIKVAVGAARPPFEVKAVPTATIIHTLRQLLYDDR